MYESVNEDGWNEPIDAENENMTEELDGQEHGCTLVASFTGLAGSPVDFRWQVRDCLCELHEHNLWAASALARTGHDAVAITILLPIPREVEHAAGEIRRIAEDCLRTKFPECSTGSPGGRRATVCSAATVGEILWRIAATEDADAGQAVPLALCEIGPDGQFHEMEYPVATS